TSKMSIENGRKRIRRGLPVEQAEWDVLIRDHHEGYIGWEAFERNQRLISDNANGKSWASRGAVRRGEALLVGDVLVHHLPQALDWVEVRAVGRREVQDDAPPWLLQPVLDGSGTMVAGVVEEDVDAAHRLIGALQRCEQV